MQTRAADTRRRILDAAVELFTDFGFGETGLNDITDRAGVSNGAFYYHFGSKEALATAVVEQGWPKAWAVFRACTEARPGLENVISMTYALSDLMKRDKSVWIANHLNQAFGQLSEQGREGFRRRAAAFVDGVADSVDPADLRADVSPASVGNMVWITVHGVHLLSDAMMDDVFSRLSDSWRLLLPAVVPATSVDYFLEYVRRTEARFGVRAFGGAAVG